ncbi:MAG: hypothetical protein ACRDYE_07580 [Acidimicrobiales bacterium]
MAVRLEPASASGDSDSEATSSHREGAEDKDRTHHRSTIERRWPAAVCCALYVVIAIALYGNFGSLGPGHMAGAFVSMDSIVQIWWLSWAAHALPNVHNLFLAKGQNYPLGQNFGVNGSMLVLGIVFAPITKLFGPVVTWNILLRLAFTASASSMCLVLRRWTTWWPAAFIGGLLYAISGYASSLDLYIFLVFVPLPPLIFLLLHEILVRQQWRPVRTGILLGLLCSIQFFISTEILAGTGMMGAVAVALLVLIHRRTLVERWRYAVTAFAYCTGVTLLLLIYPVWFTFAGPQHLNGPPEPVTYWAAYSPVDLLSLIVHGTNFKQVSLVFGGLLYVGLPLIVVLACFAVFFRKKGAILFAGAMALFALILSLGPRLWIDGRETSIALPFVLFEHLPALDGFQPGRFALFTDMFAAGMFAIGIDELWKRLRRSRHLRRLSPRWSLASKAALVGVVVVAVVVPLVPSHPHPSSPTNVPTFFTSAAVDHIPPGSVDLAYPYPDSAWPSNLWVPIPNVMLYQAVAGMRFKLIGGYGYFPSPTGRDGTTSPALLEPQSVQTLFDVALTGAETPAQRAVLSDSNLTDDLRAFLRTFDVQTVIVTHPPSVLHVGGRRVAFLGGPATVIAHVTAALGSPVETGGVTVWFHVRQRLAAVER